MCFTFWHNWFFDLSISADVAFAMPFAFSSSSNQPFGIGLLVGVNGKQFNIAATQDFLPDFLVIYFLGVPKRVPFQTLKCQTN